MYLTNHILQNVLGIIFYHLPQRFDEKNSQVETVQLNQEIRLNQVGLKHGKIKSNQRIELIKSNQLMIFIKSSHDVQL